MMIIKRLLKRKKDKFKWMQKGRKLEAAMWKERLKEKTEEHKRDLRSELDRHKREERETRAHYVAKEKELDDIRKGIADNREYWKDGVKFVEKMAGDLFGIMQVQIPIIEDAMQRLGKFRALQNDIENIRGAMPSHVQKMLKKQPTQVLN